MPTIEIPPTAPVPIQTERPRWRDTFAALRVPNYRLYVIAQAVSNTSFWMQRIAIDWLVLELTGSLAAVGLTVAMQFLPVLLLGPWGGVIADRFPKRNLLLITQSSAAVLVGLLAGLALSGAVELWHIYAISAVLGLGTVVDQPARAVFVSEMVGTAMLRNAISLNASIFHLGGLLGPAVSGALIVVIGSGWSIAANSLACVIVVASLLLMRTSELHPVTPAPRQKGQIRQALAYVRRKPAIAWTLVLLASVSIFGMTLPTLLAAFADRVYGSGAAGYGLLSSVAAIGAFAGAMGSTRVRVVRLRSTVLFAGLFGFAMVLASMAPVLAVFAMAILGVGLARLLFVICSDSLVQLSSNLAIRGRVMALFVMVLTGGQAIGGPVIGWISEELGPRLAMSIAGGVPLITAIVVALVLARTRQWTLRFTLRRGSALVSIVRAGRAV